MEAGVEADREDKRDENGVKNGENNVEGTGVIVRRRAASPMVLTLRIAMSLI